MKFQWTIEKISESDDIQLMCNKAFHLYAPDWLYADWKQVTRDYSHRSKYHETGWHHDLSPTGYKNMPGLFVRNVRKESGNRVCIEFTRDVWIDLGESTRAGVSVNLDGNGVHLTNGIHLLSISEDWSEDIERAEEWKCGLETILLGNNLKVELNQHLGTILSLTIKTGNGIIILEDRGYEGWDIRYESANGKDT